MVKKFLASGKREKLHYYLPSVTFALKTAYSIPASSIDDLTGADSIAKDIHPAAATA